MARRKSKKKQEETLVDIVEAKESAQDFIEQNQILVFGILAAIVLIVGGIFAFNNFYKKPRNEKAMAQMFQAQFQFERDSFALALENPGGGYDGFLDIIDKYNGTKASNLSNLYAGLSYLNLGRYEAAISFLKDFSASGDVTPIMKFGALGDAYSELNDWSAAISNYEKAAGIENQMLTPYYLKKLAMLHERQGNAEESLNLYKTIREKYPNTSAGLDIKKYIARAEIN